MNATKTQPSAIKDQNIKTIRFPVLTDQKLQKLAEKTGLTKIDFFIAMVDYFYKSKKDPRDLNDELLKKELVKRTDTIISFIKTMEEELLRPLIKACERISTSQSGIIKFFNEHIVGHNKQQKEAYTLQQSKLNSVATSVQRIEQAQQEKQTLKKRFSEILEFYIRNRENMSMLTKQVEKDDLNKNVRQQLINL
jgi:hypothetical protein